MKTVNIIHSNKGTLLVSGSVPFPFARMKQHLYQYLRWEERNPKVPTTPNDRAVLRLMYVANTPIQIGLVCERADGTYWCFTTNRIVHAMTLNQCLTTYADLDCAAEALREYVVDDLFRKIALDSDMPFVITRKFKERDRKAFDNYLGVTENELHSDVEHAFKCGIDWTLRSEGFPRRPSWAKFLIQNRNGCFEWHEIRPEFNNSSGVWLSTGRVRPVLLSEQPDKNIVRL